MRPLFYALLLVPITLAACSTAPAPQLFDRITGQDMMMNRPNTDQRDTILRMQADGSGTVAFVNNPDGAQPVAWSLTGNTFCIDADEGLIASFDCARLSLSAEQIMLAHTESDSVATGVFAAR